MASFEEKKGVSEVENLHSSDLEQSPPRIHEQENIDVFTAKEQSRIIRKVDWRLVPVLGILYAVSLVDRNNLGTASIAGMTPDLGLGISPRYSVISLVFFITYVLFQPPAVVVLRKFGPHLFLSLIVFSWGIMLIGTAFVQDWRPVIAIRLLLGALEAGLFPACTYLLSIYYVRYDLQKRNAFFYIIGSTISGFSGIIAYAMSLLNGTAGLAGWRWIFLLQGIISCGLGVIGWWAIVDFPETCSKSFMFLTQKESDFICARINLDRRDVVIEPFSWPAYLEGALDLKIWGFAALFMLSGTTSYAASYFLPLILRNSLGFSYAASQCLTAPPYVFAAFIMALQGWLGDKYRIRAPLIMINSLFGVCGLALLGFHPSSAVRYFGVFLAIAATNSAIPAELTYQANNIRGQWKRALCSATLVGAGGLGGVIGTTVFRAEDAPAYVPGIIVCMVCHGLNFLICAALTLKFWRANKKAERGEIVLEGLVGFRYTY